MSYQFVEDHREYLKRELQLRMKRRPLYSQRAFCRDLDISPSTLTDYFKDRLALSKGRITLLSKKIGLNEEQKNHWLDLINFRFGTSSEEKNINLAKIKSRIKYEKNAISLDEFKVISEWYHFAFLELIEMNSSRYSSLKIAAQALGIKTTELKNAVQRLVKLNLLTIDEKNNYAVEKSTQVGNNAPSAAIRQFHSQILTKAANALEAQPMNERYFNSNIIAVPENKLPEIMKNLESLASDIFGAYVVDTNKIDKDQLYCFSFQFFNLLQKGKKHVEQI